MKTTDSLVRPQRGAIEEKASDSLVRPQRGAIEEKTTDTLLRPRVVGYHRMKTTHFSVQTQER